MYGKRKSNWSKFLQSPAKKTKYVAKKTPLFRKLSSNYPQTLGKDYRAKIIYSAHVTLDAGTGTAAVNVFSCNGIYDPDITAGATHQPVGFDQLMALYGEYIVLGSEITATFSQNAAGLSPMKIGIFVLRASAVSTFNTYVEQGNGISAVLAGNGSSGSFPQKTLKFKADMNKLVGHSVVEDETFIGSDAANPNEQRYFHVMTEATNTGVDPNSISVMIQIRYDVLFRDRIQTPLS